MINQETAYQLRLALNEQTALQLKKIRPTQSPAPKGEEHPEEPVPPSVIGFWVDVMDEQQKVLYRRFIHNTIPLNIPLQCKNWSKRKRTRTRFDLEIPAVRGATQAKLYEQSLRTQADKTPQRMCHIEFALNAQRSVASTAR